MSYVNCKILHGQCISQVLIAFRRIGRSPCKNMTHLKGWGGDGGSKIKTKVSETCVFCIIPSIQLKQNNEDYLSLNEISG